MGKEEYPSWHMQPWDLGCPLKVMVPTVAYGSITVVLKPSLV